MSDYYQPADGVMDPADDPDLHAAKRFLERNYLNDPDSGVHTVAIGLNEERGVETGELAVVAYVDDKSPAGRLLARSETPIPPVIEVGGRRILTDVKVMPSPKDLRLHLYDGGSRGLQAVGIQYHYSHAVTTHRQCHNCPIPGGVQIAPRNAPWVGTLGLALVVDGRPHAITNAHVTGLDGNGREMVQPSPGGDHFGVVNKVVGIRFDGQPNYIDAAVIDTRRTGGPYGDEVWTVNNVSLDVGTLAGQHRLAQLGDPVIKSGRTTGVTRGRVVGVEGTSHVGYDEGTGVFARQYIIRGDGGDFSAGGDSGSLILHAETLQPLGLLFAGGGGETIANPIAFVLDWCQGSLITE